MMRTAEEDQSGYRTIEGYGSGSTSSVGPGWFLTIGSSGNYTIHFNKPFRGTPHVAASPGPATNQVARIQNVGSDNFNLYMYNSVTGSLQDGPFHFIARGLN